MYSLAITGCRSGRPVTIVMYHSISPDGAPQRCPLSPQAFARQVSFIKSAYRVLRLRDIGEALSDHSDATRSVVITFDDGFQDFFTHAYPVLERHRVPSTVFVPVGFIGKWDVMGEKQIFELHRGGLVDFGSHGVDHRSFGKMAPREAKRQAVESRQVLGNLLGVPVTMFAYPFGEPEDHSARTRQILAESGYQLAVTGCWGTSNSLDRLLTLRRITFEEEDADDVLRAKIEGVFDWRAVRQQAGSLVRRSCGPLVRSASTPPPVRTPDAGGGTVS
jgi:peptidoglycan/xylan/chitin deacetylase (PgdA/CDA1 family)